MLTVSADAVLIIIDVQMAFQNAIWGERNNPDCERNVAALLAAWRRTRTPIIHIQHLNPKPGSIFNPSAPGFQFKAEATPLAGEPILIKSVNSAFIGTDLESRLRTLGASDLVIAGITTDHCVSTTTRMAGNLGFAAHLVSDATATFERTGPDGRHWTAAEMHDTAIASLNSEFAKIVTTGEAVQALTTAQRGPMDGSRGDKEPSKA